MAISLKKTHDFVVNEFVLMTILEIIRSREWGKRAMILTTSSPNGIFKKTNLSPIIG